MTKTNKGFVLVLTTALISGISIFINQFGVKVISPVIFTGLKNIVVALFLFCFIFLLREHQQLRKLKRKDWTRLFLIGLVGGSIPFLLFFKGLSLTSGAQASFIHKSMFIYVAPLALLFLKERLNKKMILGIVFLLLGNFLLLRITLKVTLGRGDLLIFIATLFWAVEQIISKKAVSTISPRIVAWGRMFFGFLIILLFWLASGQIGQLGKLAFSQLAWLWITALFLFGYLITWYSGLKYIPVSRAVCVLALGAPISSLLSLVRRELLTGQQIWGIFLIALGIILVLDIVKMVKSFWGFKKLVHVRT